MGETGTSYYMKDAAYNPAGALVGATLGLDGANQWTESRIYNSRLQARRVEVTKGASTLLRLRWAYSGAYNTTTLEETGTDNNGDLRVERLEHLHQGALQTVDRSYYYTGADRLSYFAETGGKNQYFGHDAFGNVWQTSYSGVPSLRQTGSSWYLIGGSTVNNRLSGTTYDNMGNQTQLSVSAGTVASYDGENRMSKIAVGGAEIASYTYDAEGRRVSKTANGTTTYYFYDAAGQLMAEYGGPAQTAATHYFTTDYLGSTRMILGATGGCLERLDYAPFGGQISRGGYDCYGGASSEKPLYTGQMRDGESNAGTETGQDYFNARYFWANTARFTSPDAPFADQRPEDGQSWNMYAYVRNNPLRYVDPKGRNCVQNPQTGNWEDDNAPGTQSCADVDANPVGDSTLSGAGDVDPVQVGFEWLTGTGPRQRTFTDGDQFTEMLRTHSHIRLVLAAVRSQLGNCQIPTPESLREAGTNPNYSLGGFGGVPKYVGDYSTLATGGATGNLAVTYLGSYSVGFGVSNIDRSTGTASVSFSVSNSSTFASATRPPVLGYTQAWKGTVGDALNSWLARGIFGSGAMSSTQQDFFWTEQVSFQGGPCR